MATIKPTTVPSKRLAASITAASSTIQLNNILGWDGAALTASDFGTKLYCVLRNDANTLMEIMELDPSTIASSSITVLLRGLKFTGDLTTEVTANKLTWVKNETIVELGTDVPQLLKHYVDVLEAQTIAGVKTFSSVPITTGGNPTSATELATKAYVDLTATGTATLNKVVLAGTAGETITIGQLVYLKSSDSRWWLCDADTAATVDNVLLGIAQGAGTAGNAITSGVLTQGLDTNQTGLSANTVYYASNTAGGISSSAGTNEVTLGIATSTTSIHFFPRLNQQITENEQDALAGTEGTPSATNKFQTASGAQKGTPVYAASAVGTDSYAITVTPAIAAYVTGMKFRFLADVANTGACTLAVSGLAALDIKKKNDQALATGDIEAGQIVEVVYDGTDLQMQSQLASSEFYATDIQTFTTAGADTWTKPTTGTPKKVLVQTWGGGGSGAKNINGSGHTTGGGGGGGYIEKWFDASALAATETIAVAAGGAAQSSNNTAGNVGGNSTFGASATLVTAYGGGGGGSGGAGGSGGGGGAGGNAVGGVGSTTGGLAGGFGASAGVAGATLTTDAIYGAGGSNSAAGGRTVFGGGGGSGSGAGGVSVLGGNGGAGLADASANNATSGSQPSGGGGGREGNGGSGNSGAGGDGKVIVTTFF